MKRALKWIGIVMGGLLGLIILLAAGVYAGGDRRGTARWYAVEPGRDALRIFRPLYG